MLTSAFEKWLDRVGVSSLAEEPEPFTEILKNSEAQEIWELVQSWLGKSNYRLQEILHVSKLLPASSGANEGVGLQTLLARRPRRLLTPVLVWTALVWVMLETNARGVLTVGGYDERHLWRVWREICGFRDVAVVP